MNKNSLAIYVQLISFVILMGKGEPKGAEAFVIMAGISFTGGQVLKGGTQLIGKSNFLALACAGYTVLYIMHTKSSLPKLWVYH